MDYRGSIPHRTERLTQKPALTVAGVEFQVLVFSHY
jgi:hypothetical protein